MRGSYQGGDDRLRLGALGEGLNFAWLDLEYFTMGILFAVISLCMKDMIVARLIFVATGSDEDGYVEVVMR